MVHRATQSLLAVALATLSFTAVAFADSFDFIYADSIDVVSMPGQSGFNYGNDIAMLVNTRSTNIENAEFFGATFVATTSDPLVDAHPFVNEPGPPVTPILPDEAVGTILPGSPLLAKVLPGETVRNTYPLQIYGLIVNYPPGYVGTVVLYITMTMGAERAEYFTLINIQQGADFAISVAHADRAHSQSFPTAARASTWGAIKKLYR